METSPLPYGLKQHTGPSKNPNGRLTILQQKFIDEFEKCGFMSYALAMRNASGSKVNSGTRGSVTAAIPKVAAEIARRRAKFEQASAMSRKKVMDGFLEAIEMAKIKADPLSMVAGWREIARMCGYYEATRHKIEVSVNGQVVIEKLKALPDHELLALATGETLEGEFEKAG